jgi:hypothetical protein
LFVLLVSPLLKRVQTLHNDDISTVSRNLTRAMAAPPLRASASLGSRSVDEGDYELAKDFEDELRRRVKDEMQSMVDQARKEYEAKLAAAKDEEEKELAQVNFDAEMKNWNRLAEEHFQSLLAAEKQVGRRRVSGSKTISTQQEILENIKRSTRRSGSRSGMMDNATSFLPGTVISGLQEPNSVRPQGGTAGPGEFDWSSRYSPNYSSDAFISSSPYPIPGSDTIDSVGDAEYAHSFGNHSSVSRKHSHASLSSTRSIPDRYAGGSPLEPKPSRTIGFAAAAPAAISPRADSGSGVPSSTLTATVPRSSSPPATLPSARRDSSASVTSSWSGLSGSAPRPSLARRGSDSRNVPTPPNIPNASPPPTVNPAPSPYPFVQPPQLHPKSYSRRAGSPAQVFSGLTATAPRRHSPMPPILASPPPPLEPSLSHDIQPSINAFGEDIIQPHSTGNGRTATWSRAKGKEIPRGHNLNTFNLRHRSSTGNLGEPRAEPSVSESPVLFTSPTSTDFPTTPESYRPAASSYTSSSMRHLDLNETRAVGLDDLSESPGWSANSPITNMGRLSQQKTSLATDRARGPSTSPVRRYAFGGSAGPRRRASVGSQLSGRSSRSQSIRPDSVRPTDDWPHGPMTYGSDQSDPDDQWSGLTAELWEKEKKLEEREAELSRKEADTRSKEEQLRRQADETRQKEEMLRKKEEDARRKEEDARRKEEAVRRREEVIRRKEEEARRLEGEVRQKEDEARKLEEEARKKEEDARNLEEDLRQKQEDARKKEEDARQMAEDARKIEDEARRKEGEAERIEGKLRKMEADTRKRFADLKKKEEDARRKEEDARRKEEEARLREADARRKEEDARKKEEDARRKEEDARKREEDARERAEEARQRAEEAKKRAEEARAREEELRKKEQEIRQRAEDARRKEEALRQREEDLRRREQELERREEEARRQEEEREMVSRLAEQEGMQLDAFLAEQQAREEDMRKREADLARREAEARRLEEQERTRRKAEARGREEERIQKEAEAIRWEEERVRREAEAEAQRQAEELARAEAERAEQEQATAEYLSNLARQQRKEVGDLVAEQEFIEAALLSSQSNGRKAQELAERLQQAEQQEADHLSQRESQDRARVQQAEEEQRRLDTLAKEARLKAAEQQRKAEEARLQDEQRRRQEAFRQEQARATKDFERRQEELNRAAAERKRQENLWRNSDPYRTSTPSSTASQSSSSSIPRQPTGSFASSSTTASSGWGYTSWGTRPTTAGVSQPSVSSGGNKGTNGAWRSAPSGGFPGPEPTNARRSSGEENASSFQDEYARQQQEAFIREQERIAREQQARAAKATSKDAVLRVFEEHEKQWARISTLDVLGWGSFPWPTLRQPNNPEELTTVVISAYVLNQFAPTDKGEKDRIKEHIRRWHPDRFETKLLPKVRPEDRERVKEGAGQVVRSLNELLTRTSSSLF